MAIGWRLTERERERDLLQLLWYIAQEIMISSSLLCCCAWFSLDSLEPAPIELAINLSRLCSPFFFFLLFSFPLLSLLAVDDDIFQSVCSIIYYIYMTSPSDWWMPYAAPAVGAGHTYVYTERKTANSKGYIIERRRRSKRQFFVYLLVSFSSTDDSASAPRPSTSSAY